jgi:hypothetical protein
MLISGHKVPGDHGGYCPCSKETWADDGESDRANTWSGRSVGTAGDVNGDGYKDPWGFF